MCMRDLHLCVCLLLPFVLLCLQVIQKSADARQSVGEHLEQLRAESREQNCVVDVHAAAAEIAMPIVTFDEVMDLTVGESSGDAHTENLEESSPLSTAVQASQKTPSSDLEISVDFSEFTKMTKLQLVKRFVRRRRALIKIQHELAACLVKAHNRDRMRIRQMMGARVAEALGEFERISAHVHNVARIDPNDVVTFYEAYLS